MNRFTLRSALVLAAVLLLAGATTSFAQFTGPVGGIGLTTALSSTSPNPVRIAGGAEWVTDILAWQTAVGPAVLTSGAATSTLTYQLAYNAPISNKVLGYFPANVNCVALSSPYAALTVAPAAPSPIGIQVVINNITCSGVSNADPTKSTGTTISWSVSGSVLNILISTTTGQTVTLGPTATTVAITVRGVRLNVAALGAAPTVTVLTSTLAAYPSGLVNLATASFNVATSIVPGLSGVSQISASGDGGLWFIKLPANTTNTSFGACNTLAGDVCNAVIQIPGRATSACNIRAIPQGGAAGASVLLTGDSVFDRSGQNNFGGNGASANAIGIKITEGAPGILTTKAIEAGKSAGVTEVDTGVRIRFDISGLPANVVVGAAEQVSAAAENTNTAYVSASGLTVDLVNSNYCTAGSCGPANQGVIDVRAGSGGGVAFEYEVSGNTGGVSGVPASVIIPFWLWKTTGIVDPSTVTIAVKLGPILGGNVLRFNDAVQTTQTATQGIGACTTDLFYPWLLNTSGFDTGILILNGTSDQQGTCSVVFRETVAGDVKSKTTTTPIIKARTNFVFTVSDSTYGNPGMGNGFARITCNFEGAHGVAYVSIGYGTGSTLTQQIGPAPIGTVYLALQGTETAGRSSR